jgi:DNA-binding transcriptional LysR family regulator
MPQDLELGLIRTFIAVVRGGSISRAATALRRTQPAVSQQLRRLEKFFGQALVQRTPRGILLTSEGEALLPYAERLLAIAGELSGGMRVRAVGRERLGIGLMEDVAAVALPSVLVDFARLHPALQLEVLVAPGAALQTALEDGRVDLVFGEPFYMAVPPRWRREFALTWVAAPSLDLLQQPLPLVLFSQPCRWRVPMLDALNRAGRAWRVAFESSSVPAVQAAVRGGLGVSALLPATLQAGMLALDERQHLPRAPRVELALCRRPGTEADGVIDAVESLVRATLETAEPRAPPAPAAPARVRRNGRRRRVTS